MQKKLPMSVSDYAKRRRVLLNCHERKKTLELLIRKQAFIT